MQKAAKRKLKDGLLHGKRRPFAKAFFIRRCGMSANVMTALPFGDVLRIYRRSVLRAQTLALCICFAILVIFCNKRKIKLI